MRGPDLDTTSRGAIPANCILVKNPGSKPGGVLLDLDALFSNYQCSYACGCHGTAPTGKTERFKDRAWAGCCRTSPWFRSDGSDPDETDNPARIAELVSRLTSDECENLVQVQQGEHGWWRPAGDGRAYLSTHQGDCVFLNSDSHAQPGCALWHLAIKEEARPQDYRPKICHAEPIHYRVVGKDENGGPLTLVTLVPEWENWTTGGWWCTVDPDNYNGTTPVYQSMREQIEWLVADPALIIAVMDRLDEAWAEQRARYEARWNSTSKVVSLGMPRTLAERKQAEQDRKAQGGVTA